MLCQTPADVSSSAELPSIVTNDRQLPAVTADALAALATANRRMPAKPVVYVRAGLLARVVQDEQGEHVTQPLNESSGRGLLARCAHWIHVCHDKDGISIVTATFPPTAVVRDLLSLGQWLDLSPLAGITQCPTFAPSGKLSTHHGYDSETRLFHAYSLRIGDTQPTISNMRVAKQLLLENC